jgi:hypothetical protein
MKKELVLIKLFNRLDNQQKTEFQLRLSQVINKPLLSPQVEDCLISLNADNYDRMFVYTKLLLISKYRTNADRQRAYRLRKKVKEGK